MLAPRLPHFTELHQIKGNPRKFAASFTFCAHVDVIKYKKTLAFPFQCAQITKKFFPLCISDLKAVGSHLK